MASPVAFLPLTGFAWRKAIRGRGLPSGECVPVEAKRKVRAMSKVVFALTAPQWEVLSLVRADQPRAEALAAAGAEAEADTSRHDAAKFSHAAGIE